jgi:hypothetical protein
MVDKKRKSKKGKSKKGLKQKQKQKQQVTVNVSSGGGGGGFIPFTPQAAPTFDYSLLANLIRPAATVDVPIMAQQMAPALPARAAEPISLAASMGTQTPVMTPGILSAKEKAMKMEPEPEPAKINVKKPYRKPKEDVFDLEKFSSPMRKQIIEKAPPETKFKNPKAATEDIMELARSYGRGYKMGGGASPFMDDEVG